MVNIGPRPIMWHLMKYYAFYGHKDFILCLGYRGDLIKNYFLNYEECLSNDFVLSNGGKDIKLEQSDIHDWRISFVDTGLHSNIGQRLKAVEKYLEGEDVFFANYSDGLTDCSLSKYLDHFLKQDKIAGFLSVTPAQTFHVVHLGDNSLVADIQFVRDSALLINGGFFVFKKDIFKYIKEREELVEEPFQRLIAEKQLITYQYNGFFASMDTFKEKMQFDDMYAYDKTPWQVWKSPTIK